MGGSGRRRRIFGALSAEETECVRQYTANQTAGSGNESDNKLLHFPLVSIVGTVVELVKLTQKPKAKLLAFPHKYTYRGIPILM